MVAESNGCWKRKVGIYVCPVFLKSNELHVFIREIQSWDQEIGFGDYCEGNFYLGKG